jgi:hypothetical protein
MNISARYGGIEFGGPVTYRIVVKGILNEDWSDRIAGMAITTKEEEGTALTTLVGSVRDQSELNGVLDTLFGLHLAIVSVEQVEDEA